LGYRKHHALGQFVGLAHNAGRDDFPRSFYIGWGNLEWWLHAPNMQCGKSTFQPCRAATLKLTPIRKPANNRSI
jgi:hypothetical protein